MAAIMQKIFSDESDGNANKEKKTSQGYKDKRKKEANEQFREYGDKLHLHLGVIERAEMLFAQYREETERVSSSHHYQCAALIVAQREAVAKCHDSTHQRAVSELRFPCSKCGRSTGSRQELREHDCEE